jgi:hypothetical protein
MTATLLRLHPAASDPVRVKALFVGIMLLVLLATGGLVSARGGAGRTFTQAAAWPVAVLVPWAAIAVQLLLPAGRSRAGVLAMTLPIRGRALWTTSLLVSVWTAGSTALAMIAVLGIADRVLSLRLGQRLFDTSLLLAGFCQIFSAALLSSVLLHLPRPGEQRWPLRGRLGVYGVATVIIPGALLFLFRDWPWAFAGACLGGAAIAFLWGLRRQPEALLLDVKSPASVESSASRMPAWPWLTAMRWTFGLPALIAALGTVLGFGVLQAVLNARFSEEGETGLLMAPMLVYVMVTWLPMAGRYLHRLGPLPLPRWKVAALLTLPVLGAALFGYGIGLFSRGFQAWGLLVEFQTEPGRGFPLRKSSWPLLRLPAHRYEIAWNGQAPLLQAPWGERHKPWQARIIKRARSGLRHPRAARADSRDAHRSGQQWPADAAEGPPGFRAGGHDAAVVLVLGRPAADCRPLWRLVPVAGRRPVRIAARYRLWCGPLPTPHPAGARSPFGCYAR